jgi:hypothetical protein
MLKWARVETAQECQVCLPVAHSSCPLIQLFVHPIRVPQSHPAAAMAQTCAMTRPAAAFSPAARAPRVSWRSGQSITAFRARLDVLAPCCLHISPCVSSPLPPQASRASCSTASSSSSRSSWAAAPQPQQRSGRAPRVACSAAAAAAAPEAPALPFRVGHGWDLHRLEAGYPLIVGGIDIPHDVGCVAHSGGWSLDWSAVERLVFVTPRVARGRRGRRAGGGGGRTCIVAAVPLHLLIPVCFCSSCPQMGMCCCTPWWTQSWAPSACQTSASCSQTTTPNGRAPAGVRREGMLLLAAWPVCLPAAACPASARASPDCRLQHACSPMYITPDHPAVLVVPTLTCPPCACCARCAGCACCAATSSSKRLCG